MSEGPTPEQQDLRAIGVATGLGCSIVATLVLCIGGGVWLDRQFGTMPALTLVGVALGLAAAGFQLLQLAKVGSKKRPAGSSGPRLSRQSASRAASPPRGPAAPGRERAENEE